MDAFLLVWCDQVEYEEDTGRVRATDDKDDRCVNEIDSVDTLRWSMYRVCCRNEGAPIVGAT